MEEIQFPRSRDKPNTEGKLQTLQIFKHPYCIVNYLLRKLYPT